MWAIPVVYYNTNIVHFLGGGYFHYLCFVSMAKIMSTQALELKYISV